MRGLGGAGVGTALFPLPKPSLVLSLTLPADFLPDSRSTYLVTKGSGLLMAACLVTGAAWVESTLI